jgi:hypothetical protein
MEEAIIEIIKADAANGNFGLLEKILSHKDLEFAFEYLADDVKHRLSPTFYGKPLYCIQTIAKDGEGNVTGTVEQFSQFELEAETIFYVEATKVSPTIEVKLFQYKITGGSHGEWSFDKETEKLMNIAKITGGKKFEAEINLKISGTIAKEVPLESLENALKWIRVEGIDGEWMHGLDFEKEIIKLKLEK